jgi:hypothetical protein
MGPIKLYVLAFFLIFGFKFLGSFDLLFMASVAVCLVHIFYGKGEIDANLRRLAILICFICFYSGLLSASHGGHDLQTLLRSIRTLISFSAAYVLGLWFFRHSIKQNKDFELTVLIAVALVFFCHSSLMLIMYFSPDFVRNSVYLLTGAEKIVNLNTPFLNGDRITGLTYGLSQTSVLNITGVLASLAVYELSHKKEFYFLALVTAASIFVSGRTGVVLLIPCILFFDFYAFFILKSKSAFYRLFTLGSFTILLIFSASYLPSTNPVDSSFFAKHMSEIPEFLLWGNSNTVTSLSQMWFLKLNMAELFFGTSSLGRTEFLHLASDIGYVKLLMSVGVFGLMLHIAVYLGFLSCMLAALFKKHLTGAIGVVTVLCVFILNTKELAFFTRNQWSVMCLLAVVSTLLISDSKSPNTVGKNT